MAGNSPFERMIGTPPIREAVATDFEAITSHEPALTAHLLGQMVEVLRNHDPSTPDHPTVPSSSVPRQSAEPQQDAELLDMVKHIGRYAAEYPDLVRTATDALYRFLDHRNPALSCQTVVALVRMHTAGIVDGSHLAGRLRPLLSSSRVGEQKAAAWGLVHLSVSGVYSLESCSDQFVALLGSDDDHVRRHAAEAIAIIGADETLSVRDNLSAVNDDVQSRDIEALATRAITAVIDPAHITHMTEIQSGPGWPFHADHGIITTITDEIASRAPESDTEFKICALAALGLLDEYNDSINELLTESTDDDSEGSIISILREQRGDDHFNREAASRATFETTIQPLDVRDAMPGTIYLPESITRQLGTSLVRSRRHRPVRIESDSGSIVANCDVEQTTDESLQAHDIYRTQLNTAEEEAVTVSPIDVPDATEVRVHPPSFLEDSLLAFEGAIAGGIAGKPAKTGEIVPLTVDARWLTSASVGATPSCRLAIPVEIAAIDSDGPAIIESETTVIEGESFDCEKQDWIPSPPANRSSP